MKRTRRCRYYTSQHEYKLPNIEIVYNIIWVRKMIDVEKTAFSGYQILKETMKQKHRTD